MAKSKNNGKVTTVNLDLDREQVELFVAAYVEHHGKRPNFSAALREWILAENEKMGNPANFSGKLNPDFLRVNLKRLRKEGGLTQNQLADVAGLARFTIQSIENLRYAPSPETLQSLASGFSKALGRPLTVEELAAEPEN